jgi:hypothetical protein
MNLTDQQYIEHEVQIRVLKETTDSKFTLMQKNFDDKFALFQKNIDDRFSHIDYKINLLIGIAVIALLIPLIKAALGVM